MIESICSHETDAAIATALTELGLTSMTESPGYLDWDIRTGVTTWDQSWAELFGYPHTLHYGYTGDWVKSIHLDDMPRVMETLNDHLTGVNPHFLAEYRIAKGPAKSRTVRTCGVVVARDRADRPIWVIMISQEIPALQAAQAQRDC